LRTPARWRSAAVPTGFGTKPYVGKTGSVVLPLSLDWSTAHGVVRNLDDPADVEIYVDPRLLLDAWPAMTKSLAVRETWDPWIEHHMALWR
jgi:hypothetical protein